MKYDKDMYYEMVKCLGYASEPLNKWISSITADDLDNILYSCDWNMSDVMTDIANDDTVPADVREFCRLNQDNVSVFIIECTSKLFEINSPIFDSDYGNVWQNADTEILQYAACLTSDHSMYRDLLDDALENYKRFCKFDYCITTDKHCMAVREVSYIKLIDDYDDVIEDNSRHISVINDLESYDFVIDIGENYTCESIFDAIYKIESIMSQSKDSSECDNEYLAMKITIMYDCQALILEYYEPLPKLLSILKKLDY